MTSLGELCFRSGTGGLNGAEGCLPAAGRRVFPPSCGVWCPGLGGGGGTISERRGQGTAGKSLELKPLLRMAINSFDSHELRSCL